MKNNLSKRKFFNMENATNSVAEFISKLSAKNVRFEVQGEQLLCHRAKDVVLTADERHFIKTHKTAIKMLLQQCDADATDTAPLLPLQQGLLFHYLQNPQSDNYHVQLYWTLTGKIDIAIFENVLRSIFAHYSVLHSQISYQNGQYVLQKIADRECPFHYEDTIIELDEYLLQDRQKSFDLFSGPLMRFCLLKQGENQFTFLWSHHHMLIDGWCAAFFKHELLVNYSRATVGQSCHFQGANDYFDYCRWLNHCDPTESLTFWSGKIIPERLCRVHDIKEEDGANAQYSLCLPDATYQQIKRFCITHNLTLNTVLQFAWARAMAVMFGRDYALHATIISGRANDYPNVEQLLGLCINALPVFIDFQSTETIVSQLIRLQDDMAEISLHADVSIADIFNSVELGAADPYFDSLLVFENYPQQQPDLTSQLTASDFLSVEKTSYPLTVIAEEKSTLHITLTVCGAHYCKRAESLWSLFITIFESLSQVEPTSPLSALQYMTSSQQQVYRQLLQAPDAKPEHADVLSVFNEVVAKYPKNIALSDTEHQITYSEFDELTSQLAGAIQSVVPDAHTADRIIAIDGLSCRAAIIAMFAILKAGFTYLPIAVDTPEHRKKQILSLANTSLCLDDKLFCELKTQAKTHAAISSRNAQSLAYVMFTSGSTGVPKGVMIEDHAIVALVTQTNYVDLGAQDRIAQLANLGFDAATFEIYGALLNGGCLVLGDAEHYLSAQALSTFIEAKGITTLWLTASLFQQLALEDPAVFSRLRYLLFGGEQPNETIINKVVACKAAPRHLINCYGPTENTTFSSYFAVKDILTSRVPIGRPVNGCELAVLDQHQQPLPPYALGELYLIGNGLARGYLHDEARTKQAFIYSKKLGVQLYRTGDLAYFLPDGNVVYQGRIDSQVKIRGFRIELAEIETLACEYQGIAHAVAVVTEHAQSQILVLYVQTTPQAQVATANLAAYLCERLPKYSLPSMIQLVSAMPLTKNHKIDRQALMDSPIALTAPASQRVPRDVMESMIADIWGEALANRISNIDLSFHTLGGHSLVAMRICAKLSHEFNCNVSLSELLSHPTIAQCAELIKAKQAENQILSMPVSVGKRRYYPLTATQQRLWFIDQFEQQHHSAYNVYRLFEVTGQFSDNKFQETLTKLVRHFVMLRSAVVTNAGHAQLIIHDSVPLPIYKCKVDAWPNDTVIAQELIKSFDLSRAPLFRVTLFTTNERVCAILFTFHHIIVDEWSLDLFFQALAQPDVAATTGDALQYVDYAVWQQDIYESTLQADDLKFWQQHLVNAKATLLPIDKIRPELYSYRGHKFFFTIPASVWSLVQQFSLQHNITPYVVLYTVYQFFLAQRSGETDLVSGTVVANRQFPGLTSVFGLFVNTLPIRTRLSQTDSLLSAIVSLNSTLLAAYRHQACPLTAIIDTLKLVRDPATIPLISSLFVMQQFQNDQEIKLEKSTLTPMSIADPFAKFDFTLTLQATTSGLSGCIEYCTDLFCEQTISQWADYFQFLLQYMLENPGCPLGKLPLLTTSERDGLLTASQGAMVSYSTSCLLGEFQKHVFNEPTHIAVCDKHCSLSYRELNHRSLQLASYLQQIGLQPGQFVAVHLPRSVNLIIVLCAILQARGAYVPLDPSYPKQRLAYMLADSACPLLITTHDAANQMLDVVPVTATVLELENILALSEKQEVADDDVIEPQASDCAYMIYTSGSTGQPKGVMVNHQAIANRLDWMQATFPLQPSDRILQKTPYSFDVSVWELFWPLRVGATLVMAEPDGHRDVEYLHRVIADQSITVMHFVPSMLQLFLNNIQRDGLSSLRYVFCSGEVLPAHTAHQFMRLCAAQLFNLYGPTEAAVDVSYWNCHEQAMSASLPIGKPISNIQLYVLDEQLRLLPRGRVGELFIGGAGLAMGYWQRSELTQDRFIEHSEIRKRLYKTGDQVRYLADGSLEYLGRLDHQVKINGLRIELGEIENKLLEHDAVSSCAVVVASQQNRQRLVAYVSMVTGANFDENALTHYLSAHLPEYMIPTFYKQVAAIPLTDSGKVDRKQLVARSVELPMTTVAKHSHQPAKTEVEKQLCDLWQQCLCVEEIGVTDNFFARGGDSILSIQLVSLMREHGFHVSAKQVFLHPTVRDLAAIMQNQTAQGETLPCHAISGEMTVLPIQQWLLQQKNFNVNRFV